jgi:hypothetical protein
MALDTSARTAQATSELARSATAPVVTAIACLVIIAALVLGVGLASNLVVRHLVQTVPLWAGGILGFRRSRVTGWIALPCFLFWLLLMGIIWSYLLGWTHFISGHFSPVEIAVTILVAIAAVTGIVSFVRFRSALSALSAGSLFVAIAAVQWVCFRISFLRAIANR